MAEADGASYSGREIVFTALAVINLFILIAFAVLFVLKLGSLGSPNLDNLSRLELVLGAVFAFNVIVIILTGVKPGSKSNSRRRWMVRLGIVALAASALFTA